MASTAPKSKSMPLKRRLRRQWVRVRTAPALIPVLLVGLYLLIMIGLVRVADFWIVGLAATPLFFAVVLAICCLAAYRRDFYA